MAKKQTITSKPVIETGPKTTAAAARAAKPVTSRVSSAKHSKSATPETAIPAVVAAVPEVRHETVSRHEAISKIAYGYWIARGHQGGQPHEDWLRAEHEYASKQ